MTTPPIVHAPRPVTLVGGADLAPEDLSESLTWAPHLAAADAGADRCLALGLTPEAVIGDLDSLSDAARAAFADRLRHVPEQDTTDFDKALRGIDAPLVLAVAFSGGRLDHELAALHSLVLRASRPCIVVSRASLCCHCPPALALPLAPGTPVSLFPFARLRVASTGLRWPTDALTLAPAARIGTSNEATGPLALRPARPGLLVILPRPALPLLVPALLAAPRWPAARGGSRTAPSPR